MNLLGVFMVRYEKDCKLYVPIAVKKNDEFEKWAWNLLAAVMTVEHNIGE